MAKELQAKKQASDFNLRDDLDIGVMAPGDYMIHVFLQSGRSFKPEDSNETTNYLLKKSQKKDESER